MTYNYANMPVATIDLQMQTDDPEQKIFGAPALAFSPSGRYLATLDGQHSLALRQTPSLGEEMGDRLDQFPGPYILRWLDGDEPVAIDAQQHFVLYGPTVGNEYVDYSKTCQDTNYKHNPWTSKLNARGTVIAEGWRDGTVQMWNTVTLRHFILSHPPASKSTQTQEMLCGIAISPDSPIVAAAYVEADASSAVSTAPPTYSHPTLLIRPQWLASKYACGFSVRPISSGREYGQ